MAYSQALVLAGGIAHVPILITALKFADNKTLKLNHRSQAAALDLFSLRVLLSTNFRAVMRIGTWAIPPAKTNA